MRMGSGARSLLQLCFSKDLDTCTGKEKAPLGDGCCVYGVFLGEDGTVIDDAIVYQLRAGPTGRLSALPAVRPMLPKDCAAALSFSSSRQRLAKRLS
jgi:hypothetical protein